MLGFLSPTGEFHKCGYYEHIQVADKILQECYKTRSNLSVETLCDLGWVIIQNSVVGFVGKHNMAYTNEQERWIEGHITDFSVAQKQSYNITKQISDLMKEGC